jgi:ribosomal protein S27E
MNAALHLLGQTKIIVHNLKQHFWYIACNKCSKITGVEVNETFTCLNCKETDAVAQPWYGQSTFA